MLGELHEPKSTRDPTDDEQNMTKAKKSKLSEVIVNLKELEWAKVLEIPVPAELIWISFIDMRIPVIFPKEDLGVLILVIRLRAPTVKAASERRLLERISDKMETAMRSLPAKSTQVQNTSKRGPNDKQTVLKMLRNNYTDWIANPTVADPQYNEQMKVIKVLLDQEQSRLKESRR